MKRRGAKTETWKQELKATVCFILKMEGELLGGFFWASDFGQVWSPFSSLLWRQ